jgi:hypothetical protein
MHVEEKEGVSKGISSDHILIWFKIILLSQI